MSLEQIYPLNPAVGTTRHSVTAVQASVQNMMNNTLPAQNSTNPPINWLQHGGQIPAKTSANSSISRGSTTGGGLNSANNNLSPNLDSHLLGAGHIPTRNPNNASVDCNVTMSGKQIPDQHIAEKFISDFTARYNGGHALSPINEKDWIEFISGGNDKYKTKLCHSLATL